MALVNSTVQSKWWIRVETAVEYCQNKSSALWEEAESLDLDVWESIDTSIKDCFEAYGYRQPNMTVVESDVADALEWIKTDFELTERPANVSLMWGFPLNGEYILQDYYVTDSRGYAHIFEQVAAAFNSSIELGQMVTQVNYSNSSVIVSTAQGMQVNAEYAICTVPLGALQKRTVDFFPPFSDSKLAAIDGMWFGYYAKVDMKFSYNFWGTDENIIIIGEPVGYMTWGLNLDHPKYFPGSNTVTFHFAGEIAQRVEAQSVTITQLEVMEQLRSQFGNDIPEPLDIYVSNWSNDPLSYGSFTDWPLGYTEDEHNLMQANEMRLYFAGGHLSPEFFGFLHGAWESGLKIGEMVADLNPVDSAAGAGGVFVCWLSITYFGVFL